MATICKPSVIFPNHKIKQEEIITVLKSIFPSYSNWNRAETMIRNTEVETRSLILPIEEVINLKGFGERNVIYEKEAIKLSVAASKEALRNGNVKPSDINMIIVVSCTGFMMPSLTSYLINELNLNSETVQLPIAQLGCVAGGSALNRAFDYLTLYPNHNVLLVSAEFPSLCFQGMDEDLSSLIASAIFGDCVSACVIKGKNLDASGYKITATGTYLLKNSENYIKYDIKDSGFRFGVNKEVMHSIEKVAPLLKNFSVQKQNKQIQDLDFFIFHTGGRRILDELVIHLALKEESVEFSRRSLQACGNIASGAVFDVLRQEFESLKRESNDIGIMAAFGPGFTMEYNTGVWV